MSAIKVFLTVALYCRPYTVYVTSNLKINIRKIKTVANKFIEEIYFFGNTN